MIPRSTDKQQQRSVVAIIVIGALVLCAIAAFQNFAPRPAAVEQPVIIDPPDPPVLPDDDDLRDPMWKPVTDKLEEDLRSIDTTLTKIQEQLADHEKHAQEFNRMATEFVPSIQKQLSDLTTAKDAQAEAIAKLETREAVLAAPTTAAQPVTNPAPAAPPVTPVEELSIADKIATKILFPAKAAWLDHQKKCIACGAKNPDIPLCEPGFTLMKAAIKEAQTAAGERTTVVEQTLPPLPLTMPANERPLAKAMVQAREQGKLVVIVVRQTNCPPCDDLELNVTHNEQFASAPTADRYVLVTVNVDEDTGFWERYKVPPQKQRTPFVVIRNDHTMRFIEHPSHKIGGFLMQLAGEAQKLQPREERDPTTSASQSGWFVEGYQEYRPTFFGGSCGPGGCSGGGCSGGNCR